jgi:hypothetical protein
VWVGGYRENFGHFDGTAYTQTNPPGRSRPAEQIIAAGTDVWMVQLGTTPGDTHLHLVHWDGAKLTGEDLPVQRLGADVRVSGAPEGPSRVYRSGHPAKAWNGTKWVALGFDANNVWARSADEVYFTDGGDIWKWDGTKHTRVHHGLLPILRIAGSKDRGFAVGPGGLTLELAAWPNDER